MIQKSFRSAKTGRFVTSKFAKKHKATTYLDKIKKRNQPLRRKVTNYPEDDMNEG